MKAVKKLRIMIGTNRTHLGKLIIENAGNDFECQVSAQTAPELKLPDPPVGSYKLVRVATIPQDELEAYGSAILFFKATAGKALEMATDPKKGFIIPLHGGDVDDNGHLYPTGGGFRVSNDDLEEIIDLITSQKEVTLEVEEHPEGFVSSLFSNKVSRYPMPVPSQLQQQYDTRQSQVASGYPEEDLSFGVSDFFFYMWLLNSTDSFGYYGFDGFNQDNQADFNGFAGGSSGGGGAEGSYGQGNAAEDEGQINQDQKPGSDSANTEPAINQTGDEPQPDNDDAKDTPDDQPEPENDDEPENDEDPDQEEENEDDNEEEDEDTGGDDTSGGSDD